MAAMTLGPETTILPSSIFAISVVLPDQVFAFNTVKRELRTVSLMISALALIGSSLTVVMIRCLSVEDIIFHSISMILQSAWIQGIKIAPSYWNQLNALISFQVNNILRYPFKF